MNLQLEDLRYERSGEWLLLSAEKLFTIANNAGRTSSPIEAGSHPHQVRIWLLALGLFPEKWLNRLFSVGGIQMEGPYIRLQTFLPGDSVRDAAYRMALSESPGGNKLQDTSRASVLYADDWCMVMNKPAGMPVHPAAPGQRGTLDEHAARFSLQSKDPQPAKHIHRLDDDTAGPVLYARNELAQLRLDEAMRGKTIGRQYAAIVQGRIKPSSGIVHVPIGKDRHHRSRRRVSPEGDQAVTHYETIEVYQDASLVRLWLETGRTHQIRVHMSYLGHPLVGDTLYGGRDTRLTHQALRGEQLTFQHPWTGKAMIVEAPEPSWFREARERRASL
ncbi:RluA family pseudouridine synthase [Paenibacillus sp. R14(2021)]|uniref:RluA family pseudouridine synthase n=1 Tax=Paenibacillus sp. R14(2021) TaxID=2859228 RepID=UPI001C614400|nr:RluA family pseudouridine synthase [Paenibacillus sp. R14(2021)]